MTWHEHIYQAVHDKKYILFERKALHSLYKKKIEYQVSKLQIMHAPKPTLLAKYDLIFCAPKNPRLGI
jgi:hypothetical protein